MIKRNKRLVTLTEGDVMVKDEEFFQVTIGEVSIFADGTIDKTQGEMHEVSREVIPEAIAAGNEIYNYEND